ncbi:hypothetical protein ACOMHN_024618 [Nucella lapillus]
MNTAWSTEIVLRAHIIIYKGTRIVTMAGIGVMSISKMGDRIIKALMHHGVTTDDIRHRTSIQHKKDWPQYRTLRHAVPKRRTV